jgi:TPR repeat protein
MPAESRSRKMSFNLHVKHILTAIFSAMFCLAFAQSPKIEEVKLASRPVASESEIRKFLQAAKVDQESAKHALKSLLEGKKLSPIDFQDALLARDYYQYGATLGLPSAMHLLGNMYCSDLRDAKKDLAQCERWYLEAADRGYAPAMVSLSAHYRYGEKKDIARALMWLNRSAEAGDGDSMLNLARRYETGDEVARDIKLSQEWYAKAESVGVETPAVTKRKNSELVTKLKVEASSGDNRAMFRLGRAYYLGGYYGLTLIRDLSESSRWYLEAAKRGHVVAANNLAAMYGEGEGVEKDSEKSFYWYRFAADKGYVRAQINLGGMFERGEGRPIDKALALAWYRVAADHIASSPRQWDMEVRDVAQLAKKTCTLEKALNASERTRSAETIAELSSNIKSPIPSGQRLSDTIDYRQMCTGG